MMKRKLQRKLGFISFLVVLSIPCLVNATVVGTVDVQYSGNYAYESISVWGGYMFGQTVDAGVYKFYKYDSTGEGDLWSNGYLSAFCMELAEPFTVNPITYDVIMPSDGPIPTTLLGDSIGTEKAKYLQELWGRYYDQSWATGDTFTSKQNSLASVFASAIWEIVHEEFTGNPLDWDVSVDGSPILSMGFKTTDVDSALANEWLHSLDGTGPMADLRTFSYDGRQDFLVAVPEPATIALLGIGSAFGLIRRKKKVIS